MAAGSLPRLITIHGMARPTLVRGIRESIRHRKRGWLLPDFAVPLRALVVVFTAQSALAPLIDTLF